MKSLNHVTLIGHLGADVQLRQTKKGTAVANFPVATNRYVKNDNGERQEIADFHRIVAWGKLAGVCKEYLNKGTAVYIGGALVNKSFEKDGLKQYRSEIVLDDLNILSYKKDKSGKDSIKIEKIDEDLKKKK